MLRVSTHSDMVPFGFNLGDLLGLLRVFSVYFGSC
jgi:hypothetical protein